MVHGVQVAHLVDFQEAGDLQEVAVLPGVGNIILLIRNIKIYIIEGA